MMTMGVKLDGDELIDMVYRWLDDIVFPSHTISVERVAHAGGGSLSVDVNLLAAGALNVVLDSKAVHNAVDYYIVSCTLGDHYVVRDVALTQNNGEIVISATIESVP